ncbi:MAG: prolyl oligopeptidase family serine peptidase [Planctomycetes bacterium]|nr:prolyl oligopeptidase family serine peptidase [Planctomycetota bacterium]
MKYFILFCVLVVCALLQAESVPQTKHLSYGNDGGLEYWSYVNAKSTASKPPLMIFLHGKGENTMRQLLKWGPPKHIENGKEFPGVVVAPLSPNAEWWKRDRLIAFVDTVAKKYDVDLHRIYLTGLSMGGFASWDLACHYPDRFAAMVPICGGGNPELASALKDIPCRVYHGGKDTVVPPERSDVMVAALKKAGGDVDYTIFPQERHTSWIKVYADQSMYDWMYQQRKKTAAKIDHHAALRQKLGSGIHARIERDLWITEGQKVKHITYVFKNITDYAAQLTVQFPSHENLSTEPQTLKLQLAAGEKKKVEVQLSLSDTANALLHCTWSAQYDLDTAEKLRFQQEHIFDLSAKHMISKQEILVDGVCDEWSREWIAVKKPGHVLRAEKDQASFSCSWKFQTAYDKEYLYIAAVVNDDQLCFAANKNVWDQDGVEIRLDARPQEKRHTFVDWQDFLPLLISPQKDGSIVMWNKERLPKGTIIKSQVKDRSYAIEVQVPLSYVIERAGSNWRALRLNVAVNDFDSWDQRGPQLWWYPDWRGVFDSRYAGTFSK